MVTVCFNNQSRISNRDAPAVCIARCKWPRRVRSCNRYIGTPTPHPVRAWGQPFRHHIVLHRRHTRFWSFWRQTMRPADALPWRHIGTSPPTIRSVPFPNTPTFRQVGRRVSLFSGLRKQCPEDKAKFYGLMFDGHVFPKNPFRECACKRFYTRSGPR